MSKTLEIKGGFVLIVDDSDYDRLSKLKIRLDARGYPVSSRNTPIHRILMDTLDTTIMIDHKNRNKLDCRKENLRLCTKSTNGMNRPAPAQNTSGYKGVHYDKNRRLWGASIQKDKEHIFIGRFDSPEDAARAYDWKAREIFGEFAFLNFPNDFKKPNIKHRLSRRSSTGYRGVSFYSKTGKYVARCKCSPIQKCLGYFDTAEQAARIYDEYVVSEGHPELSNGVKLA